MSIVEDIKLKYQEKMVSELNKFLNAYSEVLQHEVKFDMDDYYPLIIRIIGNYVATLDNTSNANDILESSITFDRNMIIHLRLFKNTPYEEKVVEFIRRLKKAFHSSLDDDIYQYLTETDDFTENEKQVCNEFYSHVSKLNHAMKQNMFSNVHTNILDREVIRAYYDTELREFNNYTKMLSTDLRKYNIVQRFDKMVKKLASEKKPTEIFFDA